VKLLATLDLARYEVTNVAVRAWRAPKQVAPLLEAIERISSDGGVLLSTNTLIRAAQIAQEHTLSAHDAAYVAAAAQTGGTTGGTLVSCDVRDLVGMGLAETPTSGLR
jgi:predicted nucleic acid-binding protein